MELDYPQGSVLLPSIWSLVFDDLLKMLDDEGQVQRSRICRLLSHWNYMQVIHNLLKALVLEIRTSRNSQQDYSYTKCKHNGNKFGQSIAKG